jgi:hypothetical protein
MPLSADLTRLRAKTVARARYASHNLKEITRRVCDALIVAAVLEVAAAVAEKSSIMVVGAGTAGIVVIAIAARENSDDDDPSCPSASRAHAEPFPQPSRVEEQPKGLRD